MLRIRTGARHGLRGGMFGFVAALFTISGGPSHAAPYADIVVDANSGTVLHSTNPDAQRHPASLTKIMTLYLLFEQLEAGKLKLDSPLQVSKEAAGQMPTKLGLKPGSTLAVEDAIKGMVTRSANDAAVVVAEAIAGDEDAFAKLMTRKAQALGMSRTIYKNASGLPDSGQITTARDQSTLGRAVQERFPRYYKYFSIRTFVFRGQSIGNHNNLLGRVEGVDGIKTGYVNASGFNLVTSVHRGNRYLVAVVMGGSSAGSRDAKMRDLISDKIAQASVKRTAPMVAEGSPPPEARPEPKAVAKVETAPEPKVAAKVEAKPEPKVAAKTEAAKTEAKPEPKAEARFAVASAVSLPVRLNSAPAAQADPAATTRTESMAAAAQPRTAAGSTDPIRPVLVKTLSVKAGTTASLAPMQVSATAPTEPAPVRAAAPVAASAPVVAVKPEPAPQPAPVVVAAAKPEPAPAPFPPPIAAKIEAPLPALVTASKPDVPAPALSFAPIAAKAEPAAAPVAAPARVAAAEPAPAPTRAAPAAKPQHRSGWIIQVGAFPGEQEAKKRLASAQTKAAKLLTKAEAFTETVEKGGTTLYRARFAGLDKDSAEAACKHLKRNDVECVTVKN
ncbi:MAG TPA: D-alanyl-D-alanine carboxypeptidase [Xanthobacteraceae bacterium]|jgi:D-alanyl-D-alanine carboxypeptidase|nr:D-alanyl-D-alanine carboxypeptidase [Xanthobacteraceae bacterium]